MESGSSLPLRVITYNIHRAIGVDRRFRPERIVRILRHYDADVVLLQEVDEGAPRSRELNLAKELALAAGYPHFALGHNVSLRKGWYGNATLSRFPILRERNIDLSVAQSWIRRGCQHTSVQIGGVQSGGRTLEVFNLHLGLSARERLQQIELLSRSHEFGGMAEGTPMLVGGDFNDWRSLLWPTFTNGFGFRCATDSKTGRRGALATYPSFSPQGGLDRLYFRGPLRLLAARRCRLQISRVASDHLPVIAEFEMA
ncbi:MAG TPA: endonuclease/exonuclease/phosphatase family protein [Thermoanaerobaculia bacterium]|nr:endonuclease/exonuclease/phosphatase family protein [Thermoanaerobaculia bacterium]